MKKLGLLFPGQGSQYVGMGKDLYDNFDSAKELIDKADGFLDFDLKKIIFEGPEEELKKTNDQIRSFKLNDFIRGSLSIYDERKKLDAFALLDVQDSEAKLFFKCAEGANHSVWEPNNWKLDNKRYYTESYSDLVRFAKKIPEQILRLIESKDTQPDYDIFSDLFPDLSDEGNYKQKKKKKVTEKVSVTPSFIPKIYPKIKNNVLYNKRTITTFLK